MIQQIEDPDIYDGISVYYDTEKDEFTWRDAYWTNRLTEQFKSDWEDKYRISLQNQ